MRICTLPALALLLLLVVPAAVAGTDPNPVFPLFAGLGVAGGAAPAADAEDYARAEQFLPQSVVPELYNVTVEPHWIGNGPSFWYEHEGRDGTAYLLVDPVNRTRRPAFDRARLAEALANATGETVDASALPLATVALRDNGTVRFTAFNRTWEWNGGALRDRSPAVAPADGDLVSPDGRLALFLDGDNLSLRDLETGSVRILTTNGTTDYFYGRNRGCLGRAGDRRTRERHGDSLCGLVAGLSEGPHLPGRPAERDTPQSPPGPPPRTVPSGRSPTPTATRCRGRTWRSTNRS